ncbi:MAG: RagB/SusD family nutrient uptake outer membrane protein [Tannerella sp.]|jgi:tetratricopeptide (TPR) repeat protein|nr:RagB/SusD family nutrient uptake outer membrane protein [Tannerella sp.]
MKKILLYLICAAGLLSLTPSCVNDVLDKTPLDIISEDVVWDDPNLVDANLAHLYSDMRIFRLDQPDPSGLDWWATVFGIAAASTVSDESGDLVWWGGYNAFGYKFSGGLTVSGGLLEWWNLAYPIIRELNMLIEKLPESSNDPEFIASRVAEARFLRAFSYFALVKRHGGVPLVTKVLRLDSPQEELYPKRNSEKELYDFVINETDAIEEDLKGLTEYGRATQGAALALKCRSALYAGSIARYGKIQLDGLLGIPQDQAASYYQKSLDAAQKLGTLGYSLYNADADKVTNFKNVFLKKRNPEMIFAKQHDAVQNYWEYEFIVCPKPHGYDTGMSVPVYLEMVEEFEYADGKPGTLDRDALQAGLWSMEELWGGRDPRFYASVWTNGTPWKGGTVDSRRGIIGPDGTLYDGDQEAYEGLSAWGNQRVGGNFGTGFGVMKLLDETSNGNLDMRSNSDAPIFRYGEALLNLAESAYELGRTAEALEALNQIRDRAGIARKTSIDLETIQHERKVELFFEAHRYWDVRRWRIAEDKLSKPSSGILYRLDYATGKYKIVVIDNYDGATTPHFDERCYYLPITLTRTGQNPNLVENPGY